MTDGASQGNHGNDQRVFNRSIRHAAQPLQSPAFVSADARVLEALELVRQVADTDATVLILGETGTGKELIARSIHGQSRRNAVPLVSVNCGAIAESLQESELFGHVKGAFTGATTQRAGRFELAHRGTIFLDEISEMSLALQVKLLRILQSGEYSPVGDSETRVCDVRVVAATNEDPRALIERREFRKDLYYRLNIIRLEIPPLRQRKDDIPLLLRHFLRRFSDEYHKPDLDIARPVCDLLQQYDFPGNVRELENIVQRAVIVCRSGRIETCDLPDEILYRRAESPEVVSTTFHEAKNRVIEDFERAFLTSLLQICGGIISRAAERSGLSERNFHAKLRKYGIESRNARA
jgi:transcriptional regulator with PAS, ATPase and Fis domain